MVLLCIAICLQKPAQGAQHSAGGNTIHKGLNMHYFFVDPGIPGLPSMGPNVCMRGVDFIDVTLTEKDTSSIKILVCDQCK